jgi:glycosyltransferase involved in cell wall biosynthesis
MVRATFIMEQHLGHQTYYQNLRRFVEQEGQLDAAWVPVKYEQGRLAEWIPLPEKIRGSLRGMSEVRKALHGPPFDVAFFNTQVPAALGGRHVWNKPYVVATDITPAQYDQLSHLYNHRPDKKGPLQAYKHQVNVRMLRRAARLLPWSTWTRDSLIEDYGVDPTRIDVVPPGVDLSLWTPGTTRSAGPLRILFVGGDFHRKGGPTLLDAFRALPKGAAELHVVTRTQLAPEDGVHTYYGIQPNSPHLIELYQQADVFVLPTEAEAFGIAAVEACAAGLAVIATAVGGLRDIVADGETGFLVAPRDVMAIRSKLLRLAEDTGLRQRMGAAARLRAEERFDAKQSARRVVEHLLAVANCNDREVASSVAA